MIDRLQHLFKLTIIAPTVLAVGVLFSCSSNKMDEVMAFNEGELQPMRSSTNVTYTFTDSGKVKNVLFATNLNQFKDGDSTYSLLTNGFSLTFYTDDGDFDGILTAQNGYIGNDNAIMIARDSVVFVNQANEKLNTEELIWRQDSATVTTDKFVTIEQDGIVIMGKGLWSNQNFTNYEIKEPTGSFYLNENEDESGEQETKDSQ